MTTAAFTTSINSSAKTITLAVTDWGTTDGYIFFAPLDSDTYSHIGQYTIGAPPESVEIYYDGGFKLTGGEVDVIPDGVYKFKISDNADAPNAEDTIVYLYTDAQARCCISSKIAEIVDYACKQCEFIKKLDSLITMKLLLEGAGYSGSSSCGDWTEAQAKLNFVTDFCGNTGDCYKSGC